MAVFTEQEIMASAMPNIDAILDNALYLESGSTMITPDTVAVTENSAVQAMVVRFGDIETLSEEYGCDYIDAMVAVAEANDVDPSYLAVAVDEAEVIENPWIVDELDHVVINPQSENSFAYQFCEAMIDEFIDSDGDEIFLEAIVDDYTAYNILYESISKDGSYITPAQKYKEMQQGLQQRSIEAKARKIAGLPPNYNADDAFKYGVTQRSDPRAEYAARQRRKAEGAKNQELYKTIGDQRKRISRLTKNLSNTQQALGTTMGMFGNERKNNGFLKDNNTRLQNDLNTTQKQLQLRTDAFNDLNKFTSKETNRANTAEMRERNQRLGRARAAERGVFGALKTKFTRKGKLAYRQGRDQLKAGGEWVKNNKLKTAGIVGAAAAGGLALAYKKHSDRQEMDKLAEIQNQMANAPKSWIAKKIASLRKLYANYMYKASVAKATGQAGIFTKIAHRILSVIDALMKKMQNLAG